MKHAPARSNNSKPMKLRSQTTLAIEHIEMTSNSREKMMRNMIAPDPACPIPLRKWGGISSALPFA